jgi:hypothetical protein
VTRRPPALIAATLASAVALAACGGSSSGLIPVTDAHTLSSDLTVLSSGLGAHNCSEVSSALSAVNTDIFNLPSSVDTKLRNNLVKGYENLDNHARTQCQPKVTKPHHTPTHSTGPTGTTHATGPTETTTGPTGPTEVTTGLTGPTSSTSGTTGASGTVGSGGGVQAPGSTGATGDTNGGTASAGA